MEPIGHFITGKAIGGGQFIEGMMSGAFGMEILYSFIIVACSLMIYFSTKELYELTSHKGIKYFRLAFLFFAISYTIRAFIKLALIFLLPEGVHPRTLNHIGLGIFVYFSIMSIFFLLYSVMCKKWKNETGRVWILHVIALVVGISVLFLRNRTFPTIVNLILFIIVLFTVGIAYKDSKNKKKGFNLLVIYVLLLVFWILNILDILIPNFLGTIQYTIYGLSVGIFIVILYKVLTKVGGQ